MSRTSGTRQSVRSLAPHEFEQFRQLARRSFGLDLKPGKEELVSARLRRLVEDAGLRTFNEYYRHVVQDPTGEALTRMIDALATNHTSFLRETDHFDFLRREASRLFARRVSIDVWCAACATGEEVWTLAFILNDLFPARRIRITATDISKRALAFAEAAVYPEERLLSVPPEWLSRYFARSPGEPDARRVAPKIRCQATFRRLNLLDAFPGLQQFPVIFCRNVMIYFDGPTQESVVRSLSASLEPGGYLFVGHAESLARVPHSLEYVQPAVYRKPAARPGRWNRLS